ncbi:hypothetical protein ES332_D02G087300v1 [Gossypium tomentosum]|uniref:Uncharacterized protein n=1 Tax=Gossypium tomentosum TaxID=34277 RepID=A0A5D2LUR8_GOSTO|nr:hypothetical protein ES332_D02G087300v1 [Gossypium tomentosum]
MNNTIRQATTHQTEMQILIHNRLIFFKSRFFLICQCQISQLIFHDPTHKSATQATSIPQPHNCKRKPLNQ